MTESEDKREAGQEQQVQIPARSASFNTILDEQIADYNTRLEDAMGQRFKVKAQSVKDMLDRHIEEYGQLIDQFQAKRTKLEAQLQEDNITDQEIDNLVQIAEGVKDEIGDIDATDDIHAKRALLELLNIRATLRQDEAGDKWIDIHWLQKVHSRVLTSTIPHRRPC
ncbi:MAG: hypothetical protein M3R24_29460 [Chloroflexota bacterium]|nr:hypothetical protein [Chloroflexota bacterium]